MEKINIQGTKEELRKRLESGYFEKVRSKNTEGIYSEEKEARDTAAVKDFVNTDYFDYIKKMK